MVSLARTVEPDRANAPAYDDLYGRYIEAYARLNGPPSSPS